MRIGIAIGSVARSDVPLATLLDRIREAEAAGFASAWVANAFGFDAITLMALAGRETERIELGTFVVPTYPRHPLALAQQARTAASACAGRFTLGIGLSHRVVIERALGLDYSQPLRHMREYLAVLKPLLAGEAARFRGEEFRVSAELHAGSERPPLILAALGPKMLRLAGGQSDGTATWLGGPRYLGETAIPAIRRAAKEAGRPPPRIICGLPVAVTNDREAARASVSRSFETYGKLPSYRAVLDLEGVEGPADVAIIGNEDEVAAQLERLAVIGVTDLNPAPVAVAGDPGSRARAYAFLAELARSGMPQQPRPVP